MAEAGRGPGGDLPAEGRPVRPVDDTAEAVGIRKPTLYHDFPSKEAILFMIHEEFGRFTFERQQQREAAGIPPTENLLMLVTDIVSLLDT